MPIVPVIGPAGAGKSQVIEELRRPGQVLLDYTGLYAAIGGVQRDPVTGRYPVRVDGDPAIGLVAALKDYAVSAGGSGDGRAVRRMHQGAFEVVPMNLEIRSFAVELREDESRQSPGRLVGTVLTYNEMASDRREVFEPGALTWPDAGVTLNRQHQHGAPIMRVTPDVRNGAVVVDQPLPDTQAGRDAAAEVRAGLFRGLSIEFKAVRQAYRNGVRYIQGASLFAVGLVDTPSYSGSTAEVRGKRFRVWL